MKKQRKRIASIITAAAVAFSAVTLPDIGLLPGLAITANAETTTSTVNVGGTDYTLFTGFTATDGNGTNYAKLVDGNTSTDWIAWKSFGEETNDFNGGTDDPAFVEFHADAPFIPKGYVLTCDHENAGFWKPYSWALKAKLNTGDEWTTIHSSNTTLGEGKTFEIPCTNDGNNQYQYFRFEVYEVGTTGTLDLDELQFYSSLSAYTHLTVKAATCMATGIKQDCYRRNSDGKYFTDETGATELAESDVIAPIIAHNGIHHEATDVNIEYWECSMCGKYFSDEGYTTEITEEQTKIYRTITIDNSISGLVTVGFGYTQALAGTTMYLYVSDLIDASTLKVNDGAVELNAVNDIQYAFTMPAADVTVTAEVAQSNGNGDILTGSVRHTVTIVDGASITLNNAAISGSIVCEGSATIILVGTNSVSGADKKAGIQIGGSGTTLTIKGDGSLTANGGQYSAGIGLSRAWDPANDVIGGDIVIEGGNITANGGSQWGAGIGTGVIYGNGSAKTARIGDITIKGGSVNATGGTSADGIGTGYTYSPCTNAIGTVTIYDDIDKVDASSITESVTYMHDEEDVTATASDYFTIIEDGNRRIIAPKDDTDYIITIADDIEHGTLTGAATAKYGEEVTITVTPDSGYRLTSLVVKDVDNNDVATTGNSFFMPKGNVTVSAVFEQGTHGTTEFAWVYSGQDGFVTEATIYDGVTTVNLQQGQSYKILKYDNEHSYRKFLLDNNTYNATIPYSGGTGAFPEQGNGTNFKVDYNGESGFYDITMTDVGNGKWSVSILKTVGKMDNIPDQTYTGSEITPEPLVMAGSLNLTKGTDYEYSYSDNTDAGTAKVTVTFKGDYASLGSVDKTFTITRKITIADSIEHGTVVADKVGADEGDTVTLTVTPDTGYTIKSVFVNGEAITPNEGVYSFEMPAGNVTVSAEFKVKSYSVTLPANMELCEGYSLTDGKADYGTEIKFKVKDGYTAGDVKANGTELTAEDGVYTVTVEGDTEITITYEIYVTPKAVDGSAVAANITGTGTYDYGTYAELKALPAEGYNFVGWFASTAEAPYNKADALATANDFSLLVNSGASYVAVYEALASVQVTITAPLLTVNGSAHAFQLKENYKLGTTITASTNTAKFAYWKNSYGMVLSRSASYTFTVTGADTITAVFDTVVENKATLVFESAYGQVMAREQLAEGGSMEIPSLPYRNGYTALGWDMNGDGEYNAESDTLAAAITRGLAATNNMVVITPVYELNTATYTIEVVNGTGSGTYNQNDKVTVTANAAPDGQKFSHWEISGQIVSYNTTYQFFAYKNLTITAVFVDNAEVVDAKGTTEIIDMFPDKVNHKLIFISMSAIPSGYVIEKAGVIATNDSTIGTDATKFTDAANNVRVRGNSWTGTSYKYTWTMPNVGDGETWYVRAYLIYKDANGNSHTIYGDIVSQTMSFA